MATYTNLGLVQHAQAALKMPTKYMWGGILRPITEGYINMLAKLPGYAKQYPESRKKELRAVIGKGYYGVDCVGLIKSYYWSGYKNGGTGSPNYPKKGEKAYPDVNAHDMYNAAKVKGKISTIPEIPGLVVYSKTHPHVGVYIGGGYVIESTLSSRGDGVIKTKLSDWSGWEHWFECPYITYQKSSTAATAPKNEKIKRVKVLYDAVIRKEPRKKSASLGKLKPGMAVSVVVGSDYIDESTYFVYVKIKRDGQEQWVVKSALENF